MKAAILESVNSPLVIKDIELTPLQVGQVRVRVLVSGLCGAQLQEISGAKGNAKFMPHLLGHEGCGIVEEIGVGVTRVKPGDKVVMHWRVGAGIESASPSYILERKKITSGKITTLSEYSVVSENRLTVVPNDTPPNLCALLGCGITTALGTINNEAKVKFGESVLIVGCGGVGLNLIQGAKLASAYPIVGIDLTNSKRKLAYLHGATSFINTTEESFGDTKYDIIIDTTGNQFVIENTIPLLADSGRYILVAQCKPGSDVTITNVNHLFLGAGKKIIATQGGQTNPNEDIARYVKLYNAGLLKIDELVTHTYKLDDINDAVAKLKSGDAGRIAIQIW